MEDAKFQKSQGTDAFLGRKSRSIRVEVARIDFEILDPFVNLTPIVIKNNSLNGMGGA